jgi:hypothetical protein
MADHRNRQLRARGLCVCCWSSHGRETNNRRSLDTQGVPLDVDPATKEMLRSLGFDSIPVNVAMPVQEIQTRGGPGGSGPRRGVVGARQ